MKKRYSILLFVFLTEILIVSVMNENNIKAQSWIGNAVGALMVLLPIQALLFFLSKDEKISNRAKICCRIAFWFIVVCYFLGGIATALQF